jgi:hypothetical protein
LGLLPGALTPTLHEGAARLGACLPFPQAVVLLARFAKVTVSEATVRRLTERAGAAQVAVQTEEVARLEREAPDAPPGPAAQQLSVDGAMVPLLGGEWAEVKTLAVGEVVGDGAGAVRAADLSYFARLADADAFARLATGEVHRRGTESAGVVVGVVDGAVWCQGFLDYHRPDAVRVLDFAHAVEHLSAAAQAVFGPGTAAASEWLGAQAHALRHGEPEAVLAALRALPAAQATDPAAATAARDGEVGYFAKRLDQLRYADFVARGLPIGSGAVESANKLVVEARLKGAGMHWARSHVDPMVALRTAVCSGGWDAAWPQIAGRRRQRPSRPRPPAPAPAPAPAPPPPPTVAAHPPTVVAGRPTDQHPWKRHWYGPRRPRPAPATKP